MNCDRAMRILHLISSSGLFGAERVVIELSKSLKQIDDFQPIIGVIKNIYNPHVELIDEANANNIESAIFPCAGKFDFKLILLIRGFIKNNKIDLIHCHGYKSNFYGLLASKNSIPTVTTNHNWLTSHWKLKIYCFFDSIWIRFFDRIITVSEEVKNDMLKYRIPARKIHVINNGIDLSRFKKNVLVQKVREELGIIGDSKVIGTIGRLGYVKGHKYLLLAAEKIVELNKAVKFLIVGDGPLRSKLTDKAKSLGLIDHIIFTGYRKDIPELLSIMDIFVLPSLKEGFPMVLLEAMAAKKPVIATRVGAIPNVIKNNENGILVEPGDVYDLKNKIVKLIEDPHITQEIAHKGYTKIIEDFSSEIMCVKYLNLYKELIPK